MKDRNPHPYFMKFALLAATRSTCLRRQVGAVAVRNKKVLATGYNGSPIQTPHCLDKGCLRAHLGVPSGQRHELCSAVHAEQNLIIQAACFGVSIEEAVIYVTHKPCFICAKMLVNLSPSAIFFIHDYPDDMTDNLLSSRKIIVHKMDEGLIQWP